MKALVKVAAGPGLELTDVPDPTPGPTDVVVRVRACALNRLDVFIRRGLSGPGVRSAELPDEDHRFVLLRAVRFHGPDALERKYQGRYGPDGLYWMAERLSGWLGQGCDVYAYFNNDYEGNAVVDAQWLAKALKT